MPTASQSLLFATASLLLVALLGSGVVVAGIPFTGVVFAVGLAALLAAGSDRAVSLAGVTNPFARLVTKLAMRSAVALAALTFAVVAGEVDPRLATGAAVMLYSLALVGDVVVTTRHARQQAAPLSMARAGGN